MSEFTEAVAARAGVAKQVAADVLAENGVREYLPPPPAARLRVQRVWFSGATDLHADPPAEEFEFAWDVPDGVSALASAGNSAGKTSVIEIIRWLLSGRSAVDAWVFARILQATLAFSLDDQQFAVEVEREDDAGLSGRLLLRGDVLRRFDAETFEGVMEELLLPRLGLDRIGVFQRGSGSTRGRVAEAGWPLLIDALYVRPSELSTVVGGVAQRANQMLQVYLALPWYDTLLQARAAGGAARQAAGDVQAAAEEQQRIQADDSEQVQRQLNSAREALAGMADEQAVAVRLASAVARAGELADGELRAVAGVESAAAELAAAEEVHVAAQRTLRNLEEREAAGAFFRALDPRACPRCATPIGDDRRGHEAAEHVCAVCDRPAESEPDPTARERAKQQVASTAEAVASAKAALEQIRAERTAVAAQRTEVERDVAALGDSQALARRREQEALMYRLEGRVQEREATRRKVQRHADGPDETTRVVDAAQAVAEERVRDSGGLFDELNGEILTLGQRFGVSGLTKVKLNRAAHLPVTKEGTDYNFGGLSDGDKLRLKVAVVIALLRVGRRYGAGRHPGILFVDSPGAEEVATGSLNQMISGLVEVSEDLGLQIVVSTARLDEVAHVLPPERLRTPGDDQATLW